MKIFKKVKVITLPTEEKTQIYKNRIDNCFSQENMLDKWLEEHGDPQIEKYVELKLAIIDIIGFNMEPERAELKAEELIKLFEEYKKAPN